MAATNTKKRTTTSAKNKTKKELTPYETELLLAATKVKEFKLSAEANIVSIFYRNPELLYAYDNLKLEDFTNNIWKVFFTIAHDIIIKEKKQSLDEITVGLYLEKHDKLKAKYEEYGGYDTIEKAKEYVKEENMTGYINELHKWNAILQLLKMKFPVYDKLSEFADMNAEEIYASYESKLNHIFVNVEGEVKSYNIAYNIKGLIEKLDEGLAVGLPYYNLPMITKETGGMLCGNITLIGALSNVGKSTFARNGILQSIVEKNEKIVIMLNEDGLEKWQREYLVWVANNIYKFDLQKYVVRDGKYSPEVKEILYKSAEWIEKQEENKTITIIPFKRYKTSLAIKIIKKYASLGVTQFMIDTFKNDAGKVSDNAWLDMMQNMVELYDVVKPDSKNLHLTCTFQLEKGKTARQRYYSQDNIGMSKNMIDPVSTCVMLRNLFEDENTGGLKELKVFRLEGKNGRTKIPVQLNRDKKYQIAFIIKNREGSANEYQIVLEHDLSRNTLKEIGIVSVPVDF
jgi:replicative DNA helicase